MEAAEPWWDDLVLPACQAKPIGLPWLAWIYIDLYVVKCIRHSDIRHGAGTSTNGSVRLTFALCLYQNYGGENKYEIGVDIHDIPLIPHPQCPTPPLQPHAGGGGAGRGGGGACGVGGVGWGIGGVGY